MSQLSIVPTEDERHYYPDWVLEDEDFLKQARKIQQKCVKDWTSALLDERSKQAIISQSFLIALQGLKITPRRYFNGVR